MECTHHPSIVAASKAAELLLIYSWHLRPGPPFWWPIELEKNWAPTEEATWTGRLMGSDSNCPAASPRFFVDDGHPNPCAHWNVRTVTHSHLVCRDDYLSHLIGGCCARPRASFGQKMNGRYLTGLLSFSTLTSELCLFNEKNINKWCTLDVYRQVQANFKTFQDKQT